MPSKLPVICMRNIQMLYVLLFDPEIIAVFVMQQWLTATQLIRFFALLVAFWTCPLSMLSNPKSPIVQLWKSLYYAVLWLLELSRWCSGKESACQGRRRERLGFDPWVGMIPLDPSPWLEMATHSGILAWKIPWTEEPDGLQSRGSQKSQTQLSNWTYTHTLWLSA